MSPRKVVSDKSGQAIFRIKACPCQKGGEATVVFKTTGGDGDDKVKKSLTVHVKDKK